MVEKKRKLDEDAIDEQIARMRLKEIEADPKRLISGKKLKAKLAKWLS